MLTQFTTWFWSLVVTFFGALWTFVTDAFVWLVDGILSVVGSILAAIPVPQFLQDGLGSLFSGLDPGILYLVSALGVVQSLALIGAGFGFRLLRKVFTLFQW